MSLKLAPGNKSASVRAFHSGISAAPAVVTFTVPPGGSPICFLGVTWTWSEEEDCYVRMGVGSDGRLRQDFLIFHVDSQPMTFEAYIWDGWHYRGTWWPQS